MRIIFVGLHNKPGMKPLDSKTKSGKLIDRIAIRLAQYPVVKTNLFEIDFMPSGDYFYQLQQDWLYKYEPTHNDIIILLGGLVQKHFTFNVCKIVKIPHPAYIMSHERMDEYVKEAVNKINTIIK